MRQPLKPSQISTARRQSPSLSETSRIKKEYYAKHFDIACDQMVATSKWLTASLFGINGAGIITVANSVGKIINPVSPGAAFAAGLILAMLNATLIQEFYNKISEPIHDLEKYWALVEIGETQNSSEESKLNLTLSKILKWMWIPPIFGFLSGIAFIAGMILFCLNLK